ncbi:MAG: cyanophycinase [Pirellulales bacterium]
MREVVKIGRKAGLPVMAVVWALAALLAEPSAAVEEDNVLGLPKLAISRGGALVICGGGDMPAEVNQRFVELAGGPQARIVVIPTAYPFSGLKEAVEYHSEWFELDLAKVDFVHTESSTEANDEQFVQALTQATGVWLEGGAQGRLADIYRGTRTETEIKRVLERGGVVGGTSAGAAIMSQVMIRHGSRKVAVTDAGWGLVQRAVIDQHFLMRNRQQRLLGVLSRHPEQVGLGIDEGTALIVQGNCLQVVGNSKVVVCLSEDDEPKPMCHLSHGDMVSLVANGPKDRHPGRIRVQSQTRVATK